MKTIKVSLNAAIIGLTLLTLPLAVIADTGNVEVFGMIGINNVPEPDTILLIGLGAAAIWIARRIKK